MDPYLAELYGTGGTPEPVDDLEKMAQYRLLEKIAEEEGVDLNELSDEEVDELVTELAADLEDGEEEEEPEETEEELEKEAQAKFEEADFLGRTMAHAMWQELNEIEKTAAEKTGGARWQYGSALAGHAIGKRVAKVRKAVGSAWAKSPTAYKAELAAWRAKKAIGRAAKHRGVQAGAAGAAGVAAGAGGAAAAMRGKKKKSSAFDELVEQRAYEHLYNAGLADDQGNIVNPDQLQKTAGGDEFESQIDRAALELLEQAGYPVEWYEQG